MVTIFKTHDMKPAKTYYVISRDLNNIHPTCQNELQIGNRFAIYRLYDFPVSSVVSESCLSFDRKVREGITII